MRGGDIDERFARVLDAVYETVAVPGAWPAAVAALCHLFGCHFGDAFARTTDFGTYHGVNHGLTEPDYQHGMLDGWVKRNVWSAVRPVREAGLVVTTREMVTPAELRRSEMFADYLDSRDLHEGLRFDLWARNGWIQDVSLLRPWSAGPFESEELRLAHRLLPHLQRAVAVAQRLRTAEALAAGFDAVDGLEQPAFLTDGDARVLRANAAGERLLGDNGSLLTEHSALAGRTARSTARLRASVARTTHGRSGPWRETGQVRVPGPGGEALTVVAVPVAPGAGWTGVREAAALVVASPGARSGMALPSATHLAALFDTTPAEADVARLLVAGRSVAEIAAATHRSVNTVRTHVARLMAKTGTHRQSALVSVLLQAPPEQPGTGAPRFA